MVTHKIGGCGTQFTLVENEPQSDVVDDLRPLIAPLYAASARIIDAGTITTEDIRDLLSLMRRAVDWCGGAARGRFSATKPGKPFPCRS